MFIRFTASAFRKLPSIYVFSYFPCGFEGRIWDLIVSVPDHCLSFYFSKIRLLHLETILNSCLKSLRIHKLSISQMKQIRLYKTKQILSENETDDKYKVK